MGSDIVYVPWIRSEFLTNAAGYGFQRSTIRVHGHALKGGRLCEEIVCTKRWLESCHIFWEYECKKKPQKQHETKSKSGVCTEKDGLQTISFGWRWATGKSLNLDEHISVPPTTNIHWSCTSRLSPQPMFLNYSMAINHPRLQMILLAGNRGISDKETNPK